MHVVNLIEYLIPSRYIFFFVICIPSNEYSSLQTNNKRISFSWNSLK